MMGTLRSPVKRTAASGTAALAWYVVTVTAYPGGGYSRSEPIKFASKQSATQACEQFQADFDADCDPCRAYVLDHDLVPIRAGGERRTSPKEALYAA